MFRVLLNQTYSTIKQDASFCATEKYDSLTKWRTNKLQFTDFQLLKLENQFQIYFYNFQNKLKVVHQMSQNRIKATDFV